MTAELVIEEIGNIFYLCWEDEDGVGATLGDDPEDGTGPAPSDLDEYEHWLACNVAPTTGGCINGPRGYAWETLHEAKQACRAINIRLKLPRGLPTWAQTAINAGWKPPKGWKP